MYLPATGPVNGLLSAGLVGVFENFGTAASRADYWCGILSGIPDGSAGCALPDIRIC